MSEDMIERVARALAGVDKARQDRFAEIFKEQMDPPKMPRWENYEDFARAAIEAMKG